MLLSCANVEIEDSRNDLSKIEAENILKSSSLTVDDMIMFGGAVYIDYYADAVGNLYSTYSKGYLDYLDLSNNSSYQLHALQSSITNSSSTNGYFDVPESVLDFCVDINQNFYCITQKNYLLKVSDGGYDKYGYKIDQQVNLSDKFPENTVFLGITASQDNANIFVTTAMGDGSSNYWKTYTEQKIYRINANGNVAEVVSSVKVPITPNPNIYLDGSYEHKLFIYKNVLSKAKGAFVYGMDAKGTYFKAGVNTGEVTYYTPRVPIQHLTGATNKANPIALSGRQILELRSNSTTDIVIGTLPESIKGEPVLFLSNADATIFYVVVNEYTGESFQPICYRLRLN